MRTLPTALGVPLSLLLRKTMPVSRGASFNACKKELGNVCKATVSPSTTMSGRVPLTAIFQGLDVRAATAALPRRHGMAVVHQKLSQPRNAPLLRHVLERRRCGPPVEGVEPPQVQHKGEE